MYGIVEVSGHQYKVQAGDLIDVQKLNQELGETVEFNDVLFIGGDKPQVGLPTVSGAKVTVKVVRQAKDRKIIVFKRKPGMYQKRMGHRTHYTALLVTEVTDGQGNVDKIDPKSKLATKHLK